MFTCEQTMFTNLCLRPVFVYYHGIGHLFQIYTSCVGLYDTDSACEADFSPPFSSLATPPPPQKKKKMSFLKTVLEIYAKPVSFCATPLVTVSDDVIPDLNF